MKNNKSTKINIENILNCDFEGKLVKDMDKDELINLICHLTETIQYIQENTERQITILLRKKMILKDSYETI